MSKILCWILDIKKNKLVKCEPLVYTGVRHAVQEIKKIAFKVGQVKKTKKQKTNKTTKTLTS